MTLHWDRTASDCRVAEFLQPYVDQHFQLTDKNKWIFKPSSPLARPARQMNYALDSFIHDLYVFVPPGTFWDRTRHRIRTDHGLYQLRRLITNWTRDRRDFGDSCLCGKTCHYPSARD